MNFGEIKNKFSNIMVEGMLHKDSVKINAFKKYVKTLKENTTLSKQLVIYENLEKESIENSEDAKYFVNENFNSLLSLNKNKLASGNLKLESLLKDIKIIKDEYSDSDKELHESINIILNRNVNTIKESVKANRNIIERVASNTEKVKVSEDLISTSVLSKITIDKFNEKYGDLSESDAKLVKVMLESSLSDREDLLTNEIKECLVLINTQITESDIETRAKLLDVKERLLETKFVADTFVNNYTKIVGLKETLK